MDTLANISSLMCVCDHGYTPVSADAFENAQKYRKTEHTTWVNAK